MNSHADCRRFFPAPNTVNKFIEKKKDCRRHRDVEYSET